jgi:hypothetical protein
MIRNFLHVIAFAFNSFFNHDHTFQLAIEMSNIVIKLL